MSSKKSRAVRLGTEVTDARSAKQLIAARAVVSQLVADPTTTMGNAIRAAGLGEHAAQHPAKLVESKGWQDLLDEFLPQHDLLDTHKGLLRASNLDHMVFGDGAKDESEAAAWLKDKNAKDTKKVWIREDMLTDDDIREMMLEKNCTVRRITRTENQRHVYFWSADNRARKDALDMAYKLRGTYAAEKHVSVAFSLADLAAERDSHDAVDQIDGAPSLGQIEQ